MMSLVIVFGGGEEDVAGFLGFTVMTLVEVNLTV
jgi:hypothetical protein